MRRAGGAATIWLLIATLVGSSPQTVAQTSALDQREVRATILKGVPVARPAPPAAVRSFPSGEVSLNFPGVDIAAVTKAVIGDTLNLPFAVDSSVHGPVTVQTPRPIRRSDVLAFFEQSLTNAGLVLTNRAGVYTVVQATAARGDAPVVGPADTGFGNETIVLKFVNADQIKKLLDPLVPNAIASADAARNVLVVSGTSPQRRALRELVAEFDVNWLRGMSFGLFVPQRTDARLIAPELEKLLNAPGAPSAGLVRLIAMDRLNGILAISAQPQYLEDTRRFVEILDREGEGAQRRMFVYHVQNGRAADLTKVLSGALGIGGSSASVTNTDPTQVNDLSAPTASTAPPAPNGLPPALQSRPGLAAGPDAGHPLAQAYAAGVATASDPSGTTITADETSNAIVVYATPRNYAVIEDALRKLDVLPLQVLIEASISEVTLNHNLQYGIQWYFQNGNNSAALTQGNGPAGGGVLPQFPQQVFPAFSYLYNAANIRATVNALAKITDVTVLSAPQVMVLNNHTATVQVGDQVPVSTGSAVSTISGGAPIVNSIEYRDTGVILKVTPRVNTGGLVLLDIAQEVSDVSPNVTSKIDSPTIQQRKIATSVAVQDGETIALGGLIKNRIEKGQSTVPLLGRIPILGHLFGDTSGALIRTELIVLLTPHVVATPVDARAITEELRSRIHLAAPPPPPERPPPPKPPRGAKASNGG